MVRFRPLNGIETTEEDEINDAVDFINNDDSPHPGRVFHFFFHQGSDGNNSPIENNNDNLLDDYYTDVGRKQSIFRSVTFWAMAAAVAVAVAVFAWLVSLYGPSQPPMNPDGSLRTWSEFTITEVGRLLSPSTALYAAMKHVTTWTLDGVLLKAGRVRFDVQLGFQEWWQERRQNVCPLIVPELGSSEEWLETRIVDQSRAVLAVSSALDAWDMEVPDKKRPLVLLLVGLEGVGKTEMARQVAHLVFQNCPGDRNHGMVRDEGNLDDGLLLLRGSEFSSDEANGDTSITHTEEKLWGRIGDHVKRQRGEGAVVVIQHVEKMPNVVFKRLCRQINTPGAVLSYYSQEIQRGGGLPQKIALDKVIFIFTTDVGAANIRRSIVHDGPIENQPQLDLALIINVVLDVHFGDGDGELVQVFQAVAPFQPLSSGALQRILHQKVENLSLQRSVSQWKRLVLTEAASKGFVSEEHVPYTKARKRDSEVPAITYSTYGAKVFETGSLIMNRVKASIKRCLPEAHPDRFAVLDFDSASRKALLCWCDDGNSSCGVHYCPFSL